MLPRLLVHVPPRRLAWKRARGRLLVLVGHQRRCTTKFRSDLMPFRNPSDRHFMVDVPNRSACRGRSNLALIRPGVQ